MEIVAESVRQNKVLIFACDPGPWMELNVGQWLVIVLLLSEVTDVIKAKTVIWYGRAADAEIQLKSSIQTNLLNEA